VNRGVDPMAIPDYQTLMVPVLTLASKGETRVPDVAEKIANDLGLSQAAQTTDTDRYACRER
jgi:hypothetical protein